MTKLNVSCPDGPGRPPVVLLALGVDVDLDLPAVLLESLPPDRIETTQLGSRFRTFERSEQVTQ